MPTDLSKRVHPADILLVEDNPSDVYLTEEALRSVGVTSRLHVAYDGVEAMAFLRREGIHAEAPRPDLVLLDLNLPRKDGRRVLAEIKEDEDLRRIPVIVLTTSNAPSDIVKCYDLHANCYIVKPVDFDQFETVIRAIEQFWFTYVMLPARDL
jgi:CheY-like chemotaxis protein